MSIRLSYLIHNVPVIVLSQNVQGLLPVTKVMSMFSRTDPRLALRPAEGPNSFHWKNVKLEVLSCCTKFHERLKKSLILIEIGHFHTVAPVRIHRWLWNDVQSLKYHRRGALLFFKVICQISRSHETKIDDFYPNWVFQDCNSSLNSLIGTKCCTKLDVA